MVNGIGKPETALIDRLLQTRCPTKIHQCQFNQILASPRDNQCRHTHVQIATTSICVCKIRVKEYESERERESETDLGCSHDLHEIITYTSDTYLLHL